MAHFQHHRHRVHCERVLHAAAQICDRDDEKGIASFQRLKERACRIIARV